MDELINAADTVLDWLINATDDELVSVLEECNDTISYAVNSGDKNKLIEKVAELWHEEKLIHEWNETIELTDEIAEAYSVYMDTAIDWDINGKAISRRAANWNVDILSFSAGVQYARSL